MNQKGIFTKYRIAIYVVIVTVIIGIAAFLTIEKVDNGNVGLRVGLSGKIISKTALAPGFHFAGLGRIVEYPSRMVQADYNKSKDKERSITVSTSDGKRVDVEVKVNYHAESTEVANIYKKFGNVTGESMEDGWLRTQTQNTLRDQYVKHSILDVLTGRAPSLEADVLKDLRNRFAKEGYVVDDVTLGIPDVDNETKKTIDSIIKSTQDNEKAKKDAETAQTIADKDAAVAKTKADADLYTAQKTAEANAKLSSSITDELVRYKEAEARMKHGWVTVQGAESTIVDK
ncbi:SPFH domain-containing protein [Lactococcus chungangensis]|uniref:SPFH domain-containing protein n=1 Tax=Pseudolactococcus chungangensis TaxID=451457 RepID=UPI00373676E6